MRKSSPIPICSLPPLILGLSVALSACILPFGDSESDSVNEPRVPDQRTDRPLDDGVPSHGVPLPRAAGDEVLDEPVVHWGLNEVVSVDGLITPEEGGELTLSDLDGVSYALTFPPGAVEEPTSIAMTALEDVVISGSGEHCDIESPNDAACFRGVLIEPNGLYLLREASFRMELEPGSPPAPGLGFVTFGASELPYEFSPTERGPNSLETLVSRLSGLATAAPDSLALEALSFPLFRAVISGLEAPREFMGPLSKLVGFAKHLLSTGHTDLALTAGLLASNSLDFVCDVFDALDPVEWDEGALYAVGDMLGLLEANRDVFASFDPADEAEMVENMWKVGQLWSDEGLQMCLEGACSGRDRLSSVLDLFELGILSDNELAEQVEAVHDACCLPLSATLETTDSHIARAALPGADHSLAYTPATVPVSRGGRIPIDGAQVDIVWDQDVSILRQGESEDGEFLFPFTAARVNDSDFGCGDHLPVELTAIVTLQGETASSAPAEVVIDNLTFETTVSYQTNITLGSPRTDGYLHLVSDIRGSVTTSGMAGCAGYDGERIDRVYTCEMFDQGVVATTDIVGGAPLSVTLSRGEYVLETLGNGVSVPVLDAVDVHRPCDLLNPVTFRHCEDSHCTQFVDDIPIEPHALLYPLPWPSGLCDNGLSLRLDGLQSESHHWIDDESDSELRVDVSVNTPR